MKVLVADDHAMFLDGMAAALRRRGHEVVGTTATLTDLVGLVTSTAPDLCLLDLWFGEESALAIARAIRETRPGTKIVLLTGDAAPEAMAAHDSGTVDAIAGKHWDLSLIEQLCLSVLAGRPVRRLIGLRAVAVDPPAPDPLTEREHDVLRLLAGGASTVEIRDALGISEHTVRTHIRHVLAKLCVHSRVEALRVAYDRGLVTAAGS